MLMGAFNGWIERTLASTNPTNWDQVVSEIKVSLKGTAAVGSKKDLPMECCLPKFRLCMSASQLPQLFSLFSTIIFIISSQKVEGHQI